LRRLWWYRTRSVEAEEPSRDDGTQHRVVRSVSVPNNKQTEHRTTLTECNMPVHHDVREATKTRKHETTFDFFFVISCFRGRSVGLLIGVACLAAAALGGLSA